ncbi:hypothetical protein HMPREF9074_07765 [Capnocytophaga sp. oral taxon 329 str. F0087]|nr:hypothetical protein HMPREF9074_07765 [Capnocytophaga sp. oral taxon 329 str. F0087]
MFRAIPHLGVFFTRGAYYCLSCYDSCHTNFHPSFSLEEESSSFCS